MLLVLMAYGIAYASPEEPKKSVEAVDVRRMEVIQFNKVLGSKVCIIMMIMLLFGFLMKKSHDLVGELLNIEFLGPLPSIEASTA